MNSLEDWFKDINKKERDKNKEQNPVKAIVNLAQEMKVSKPTNLLQKASKTAKKVHKRELNPKVKKILVIIKRY